MAKLDRLLKRFFQIKAMKPLMGLGEPLAPVIANTTPVLELIATEASNLRTHRGHATELGGRCRRRSKACGRGEKERARTDCDFGKSAARESDTLGRPDAAGSVAEDLSGAISFSRLSHGVVRL